MKRQDVLGVVLMALVAMGGMPAAAQTRTPWQMHDGPEVTEYNPLGLMPFSCLPMRRGDKCEYNVATLPSEGDPRWWPAPNAETIEFLLEPSRVCEAPITCRIFGDFTYFQTFVNVPANLEVTEFTLSFSGVDDGVRVTIFNSEHPGGIVAPGSYVYLGGSGTENLAPYIQPGEINRVVLTQVDDCCALNRLESAVVVLNGEAVDLACEEPEDCNDGNACTQDLCNADGSCGTAPLECTDGDACTAESCDPASGCQATPVSCDDGNACTAESCDSASGCQHTPVSCDDGNACTAESCDPVSGCQTTPVSCDDGNACTADSCHPTLGCQHTPVICNDNSLCTTDSCNPQLGCEYTPKVCDDGNACTLDRCEAARGCFSENQCPSCAAVGPTVRLIGPPDNRMVSVRVTGVTDPQRQLTAIRVNGIAQDEPTRAPGETTTCPDGAGLDTSAARVRAQRLSGGNGRVYHISFTATDPDGYSCTGTVSTCVPRVEGNPSTCVDEGPRYNSLTCGP
jgi:hypothetical protein